MLYRCIEPIEERLGIQAHPERQHQERGKGRKLPDAHVLEFLVLRIFNRPEHRALIERQHVGRAEHDAARGESRPRHVLNEDALQDQQLPDEPVQRR